MTPRALRLALLAASVSLFAAPAAHAAAPCDDGGTADDAGACLPTSVDGTPLCPVASIGTACTGVSGGTCVAATLVDTSADGAVTSTSVGACVALPSDACPTADVGMACGDGGICAAATSIGGGGGSVGGGSSSLSYGIATCEVIGDASPSADAATLSFGDDGGASASSGSSSNGSDASTVATGATPTAAPPSSSSSSGGCTVAGGASGAGGVWLMLGAIALWHRRRKGSAVTRR